MSHNSSCSGIQELRLRVFKLFTQPFITFYLKYEKNKRLWNEAFEKGFLQEDVNYIPNESINGQKSRRLLI